MIFKVAVRKSLAKLIGKHLWWSSLSMKLETGLYNWRIPSEIFSSKFWYKLLWYFTSIVKAITVLFLLPFDSCPDEAIMIWLTKQMSTFISVVRRCFCEIVWPKRVDSSREESQRWSPVLIKLQGSVSKARLQHRLFPGIFPILEQPFCRAHVSISSWSLNAFLVFNREALLCSLLDLATHKRTKEQLPRKVREKGFIGNVSF